MINIKGLDKKLVFRALYNNAKPLGMGFIHFIPGDMTDEQVDRYFQLDSDYVMGRVMKVDITEDSFNPYSYDRDNGEGLAQTVIEDLYRMNILLGE